MLRRGLVKCSSLFFIVFLMCPRRIRPTAIGKENYFHAVRRTNDIAEPFECCNRFPNDEDVFLTGVDEEPGFDLSEDEIRKFKLWPDGIIPYFIDAVSFQDKVLRDRIRSYLNSVNTQTRLSFLELSSPPRDDNMRWVFFANRRGQLGCADHSILNFTNEGVQHVNLGYDCLSTGGELAEAVLAIAGVPPQHNAPNRDEFIRIEEENIMPDYGSNVFEWYLANNASNFGYQLLNHTRLIHIYFGQMNTEKKYLFQKLNNSDWLFHDIEYDITSASHYHHHKYSINGQPTIVFALEILQLSSAFNKVKMMGESHGFSRVDVDKLRMLYNYIVKKKENKVPECDKLFRKGRNFDNQLHRLDVPDITKPRQKPNKYLGLPEETNEFNKDANSDMNSEDEQNNGDDIGDDNEAKLFLQELAGEKVEYKDIKADYVQVNDAATNADYEQVNDAPIRKMNIKFLSMKSKNHKMKAIDPIWSLSDYKSYDRRRKASGKNTNLKAVNI